MKVKTFKSGAWTVFEKDSGGLWNVKVYLANGELKDKIRCDDYQYALTYLRAFNAVAKAA